MFGRLIVEGIVVHVFWSVLLYVEGMCLFWVTWCNVGRMCVVVRLFVGWGKFGGGVSGGC